MYYYSTNKNSPPVTLPYAVLKGLADDGGLYMPERILQLDKGFFASLHEKSFHDIALTVASSFVENDVPGDILKGLVDETLNFDIPLVQIDKNIFVLELFHGPTMAFKDVGARFMSRLMSWLQRDDKRKLKVVVATSGDTGSAVAAGFYDVPGIDVYVLFPKGKVSPLQQKQITTWGKNICAIEIDGTFDDCQKLAKQVLADKELNNSFLITSANSINIARLIPQSFYYFWAVAQMADPDKPIVFSVPSGNFGNITAGLLASKMGLEVERFIAATNINDVVPQYYKTSVYTPRPSVQTISNAMDVGNPSNYARIQALFGNSHPEFCKKIYACAYTDDQTRVTVESVLKDHSYLTDPHGAVAWMGAQEYLKKVNPEANIIFLETAHPAKFPETLKIYTEQFSQLPEQLQMVAEKEEKYISLDNNYDELKGWIERDVF
jgi:threonine synthase